MKAQDPISLDEVAPLPDLKEPEKPKKRRRRAGKSGQATFMTMEIAEQAFFGLCSLKQAAYLIAGVDFAVGLYYLVYLLHPFNPILERDEYNFFSYLDLYLTQSTLLGAGFGFFSICARNLRLL